MKPTELWKHGWSKLRPHLLRMCICILISIFQRATSILFCMDYSINIISWIITSRPLLLSWKPLSDFEEHLQTLVLIASSSMTGQTDIKSPVSVLWTLALSMSSSVREQTVREGAVSPSVLSELAYWEQLIPIIVQWVGFEPLRVETPCW